MKKILLSIVTCALFFPVTVNAVSTTYDTAVNQIESISSSSNQFTDFIYIVELSNVILENQENLSDEELEKLETLMMTRVHERFEPLYKSYFKSIESTDGAYQTFF